MSLKIFSDLADSVTKAADTLSKFTACIATVGDGDRSGDHTIDACVEAAKTDPLMKRLSMWTCLVGGTAHQEEVNNGYHDDCPVNDLSAYPEASPTAKACQIALSADSCFEPKEIRIQNGAQLSFYSVPEALAEGLAKECTLLQELLYGSLCDPDIHNPRIYCNATDRPLHGVNLLCTKMYYGATD